MIISRLSRLDPSFTRIFFFRPGVDGILVLRWGGGGRGWGGGGGGGREPVYEMLRVVGVRGVCGGGGVRGWEGEGWRGG